MPDDDTKRAMFRALADRIRDGSGKSGQELRTRAFRNDGLAPPLRELIAKVAASPSLVTDADFATAKAAGFSEDQLFELVVCAAVGQADRQYRAGLAALAAATAGQGNSGQGPDHAA